MTPVAIIRGIGNKIKEKFDSIKASITKFTQSIAPALDVVMQAGKAGDLSGVWSKDLPEDPDNPIGKLGSAIIFGTRLSSTAVGLFPFIGNKIKEKFAAMKASVTKFTQSIAPASEAIMQAGKAGDLGTVWSKDLPEDPDNPIGKLGSAMLFSSRLTSTAVGLFPFISNKIKEKFTAMKASVVTFTQSIAPASEAIMQAGKAGDLGTVWSKDLPEDPDNPISGFGKAMLIGTRLSGTAVGLFPFIGNKINEFITNIKDKVSSFRDSIAPTNESIMAAAYDGDISGVWSPEVQEDPDNPIGFFGKAALLSTKIVVTPATIIRHLSNSIREKFIEMGNAVKSDKELLEKTKADIEAKAQSGDVGALWDIKYEGSKSDPLAGIYHGISIIHKVMNTIPAVLNNLSGDNSFLNKFLDWAKDKIKGMETKDKENNNSFLQFIHDNQSTDDNNTGGSGRGIGGRGRRESEYDGLNTQDGIVSYQQDAPELGDTKYGKDSTLRDSGCAPAALATLNTYLSNKPSSVRDIANDAVRSGARDETGTNANFISAETSAMGISTSRVDNPLASDIERNLKSGRPVLTLGQDDNNIYTTSGHYLNALSLDSNGNVVYTDSMKPGLQRAPLRDFAKSTSVAWKVKNKKGYLGGTGNKINITNIIRSGRKGGRGDSRSVVVAVMRALTGKLHYTQAGGGSCKDTYKEGDTTQSRYNIRNGWGDCSSTCEWVMYNVTGVDPGTYTVDQANHGTKILGGCTVTQEDVAKLQPGDLVFYGEGNSHVEMYVGDGKLMGHGGGKPGGCSICNHQTHGPTEHDIYQYRGGRIYGAWRYLDGSESANGDLGNFIDCDGNKYTINGGTASGGTSSSSSSSGSSSGSFMSKLTSFMGELGTRAMDGVLTGKWDSNYDSIFYGSSDSNSSSDSSSSGSSGGTTAPADLSAMTKDSYRNSDIKTIPKLSVGQIKKVLEDRFTKSGSIFSKSNAQSDAEGIEKAQTATGLTSIVPLSIGAQESGWGTSQLAHEKGNMWGWGATNINPGANAKTFSGSTEEKFTSYMNALLSKYYDEYGAHTIHSMGTGDNPAHQGYAQLDSGGADSRWADAVTSIGMMIIESAKSAGGSGAGRLIEKLFGPQGDSTSAQQSKEKPVLQGGSGGGNINVRNRRYSGITHVGGKGSGSAIAYPGNLAYSNVELGDVRNILTTTQEFITHGDNKSSDSALGEFLQSVIRMLGIIANNTGSMANEIGSISTSPTSVSITGGDINPNLVVAGGSGNSGLKSEIQNILNANNQTVTRNQELANKIARAD